MTQSFRTRLATITPLITTAMFETANTLQMVQMWRKHSALGQSLASWVMVNIALWLWLNFYYVKTPNERNAIIATKIGIVINAAVVATVAYFTF